MAWLCIQVLNEALAYQIGAGERLVKLAAFVAATDDGCLVYLRREQVPANDPLANRELLLPLSMTIQDALQGQCIVEFPRFRVVLRKPVGPEQPGQEEAVCTASDMGTWQRSEKDGDCSAGEHAQSPTH